jgi:hypothetical protein
MPDVSHLEHPSLYRAIRSRSWLALWSAAFRLRPATEQRPAETGLSVILSASCTKLICDAGQNKCFGEFVLETLAVTSRWRVELDAPEDLTYSPNHANILGLPLDGSDELAIEEAASDLADLVIKTQPRPS